MRNRTWSFLDVQMPGNGRLRRPRTSGPGSSPAIVFVTAYDQYALRAFEAGALDNLLKPFDNARFERAVERAKQESTAEEIYQESWSSWPSRALGRSRL
ncbi:MAG: hypothetical protein WB660_27040 [Candidatus Sulfotelmatobacter sp.]